MKKIFPSILLLSALVLSTALHAQTKKKVMDYLGVPGPVVFDNRSYKLVWSSHPTNNYYKQEYIIEGDKIDRFNTMIMLEALTGDLKVKDAAIAKLEELKKLKTSNPTINYESFENTETGEYMIDFLITQTGEGNALTIAERNVYRYLPYKDKNGKKGLVLFAVSTRSYGSNINTFLTSLKTKKSELVNKVAAYKVPELKIVE